jgi:hypothetical protein
LKDSENFDSDDLKPENGHAVMDVAHGPQDLPALAQ